ncbi:metal ion transporter [Acrasis kona]|uniref:Metal ion transporter n=1 Tax=Acrasis kona TaxID=1008807 RepID=A0AAW2YN35_9EUKA
MFEEVGFEEECVHPGKVFNNSKRTPKDLPSPNFPHHYKISEQSGHNMSDVMRTIKFSCEESRFIVMGLGYECHAFKTVEELWSHIKETYQIRYKTFLRRFSKPNQVLDYLPEFHQVAPNIEPIWIDIQNPSNDDMLVLQEHLGLHSTTLSECTSDSKSGEKWDSFEEYLLLTIHALSVSSNLNASSKHITKEALSTQGLTPLQILLFDHCIVTIHKQPISGLELVMRRVEREFEREGDAIRNPQKTFTVSASNQVNEQFFSDLSRSNSFKYNQTRRKKPKYLSSSDPVIKDESHSSGDGGESGGQDGSDQNEQEIVDTNRRTALPGSDWVMYAILDALADRYIPNVDIVVNQVDTLDQLIANYNVITDSNTLLKRMGIVKKTLNALRRMMTNKHQIGTDLISRRIRMITPCVQISLHDVVDRLTLACDRLDEAANNLEYIQKNFLARMQLSRIHSIKYKKELMRIITLITAFVVPCDTMIQVMSISINTPGIDYDGLAWWFWSSFIIILLSFVVMMIVRHNLRLKGR